MLSFVASYADKLRSIQVLRGLAACGVVLLHSYLAGRGAQKGLPMLGASGVDVFFVISGYIIATIAPGQTPGRFLASRFWRVYPPWLLAVVPWLLITPLTLTKGLASVTLWPIYGDFTVPALDLGWTLSFELLFYLATAIALQSRAYVPLFGFAAAIALNNFSRWVLWDFVGNPIIFEFLIGVALVQFPKSRRLAPFAIALSALLLACSPVSIYNGHATRSAEYAMCRVLLWGVPSALLVYGCATLESAFRSSFFEIPVVLGNASYSIYLWHPLFLRYAPGGPWIIEAFFAVVAGVAVYFLVEKPLLRITLRFRSKVFNVRRQAAAVVALST